ncbi:3-ketoacyl-CoA thiolase 2, peroxisomal [Tanacetum coccineum]
MELLYVCTYDSFRICFELVIADVFRWSGIRIVTYFMASVCAVGDSSAYQRSTVLRDDVVVVATYRTPLCKSKRGGLKDTYPDDILTPVLNAVIEKTNLNPAEVGDMVIGSVLGAGSQRARECKMATSVGLACCLLLTARHNDIGIGAGLESMTANPMAWDGSIISLRLIRIEKLQLNWTLMKIKRTRSFPSRQRRSPDFAHLFGEKIVDPKTREETLVTISVDDGIRPGTTLADLEKTEACISSQVSNGAGAVLLMKRSLALQKGLLILGVFRHLHHNFLILPNRELDTDPQKIQCQWSVQMTIGHPVGCQKGVPWSNERPLEKQTASLSLYLIIAHGLHCGEISPR